MGMKSDGVKENLPQRAQRSQRGWIGGVLSPTEGAERMDRVRRDSTTVESVVVWRCNSITVYDIICGETGENHACSQSIYCKDQTVCRA